MGAGGRARARAGAGEGEGKRGQRESPGAPLFGAHPNHTMAPMLCGENTTMDLSFRTEHQHEHIKIRKSIRSNHLHVLEDTLRDEQESCLSYAHA